jgi:hypothetical protein
MSCYIIETVHCIVKCYAILLCRDSSLSAFLQACRAAQMRETQVQEVFVHTPSHRLAMQPHTHMPTECGGVAHRCMQRWRNRAW